MDVGDSVAVGRGVRVTVAVLTGVSSAGAHDAERKTGNKMIRKKSFMGYLFMAKGKSGKTLMHSGVVVRRHHR